MILEIKHTTRYNYDNEVILNPHTFYLSLQNRTYFQVLDFSINIDPTPIGLSALINLENTAYYQAWFNVHTNHLNIEINSTIKTIEFNPLNFIYESSFQKKSTFFDYGKFINPLLQSYMKHMGLGEIKSYTSNFYQITNDIVTFLNAINEDVYKNWVHEIRMEDGFQSPFLTFTQRRGSCRDLAFMMMEMLKSVGLATRFVSGYAFNPELSEEHNLHAWLEVYIPGAGWVGLDPSLGLFTDYNYFPLATSFDPANTAPVIGTYGGFSNAELITFVEINQK